MATDFFVANPGAGGDKFASDLVDGERFPLSKIDKGADGASSMVSDANPFPVEITDGTNPVVIKQLSTVPVATDAALMTQAIIHGRTTAGGGAFVDVKVNPSGSLAADVSGSTGVGVTGPLTNAELRAANVPISNNATVFLFSTNNSSTTQLAAGDTFTGVIETALDQPSLSLLMTSDQNMIITVRQFIDLAGTRAAPNIVFNVSANTGLARSLPLNGNYVQVLAQNIGASTTTTFNINTAYGDILPADNSGALPTTELPLVIAGQAAQTATVNNILTTTAGTAGIDVSGYRAASVQIKSTATGGTFIFEQSNVGGTTATDWIPLPVFNGALTTGVPITAAITATASAIIYSFAVRCTFVRVRIVTTLTGGSIQAFSRFSTDSWTPSVNLVASNTAANLQTTATVTGYPTAAASADALANPTVTKVDATNLVFNGTTWDRQRGMSTALTTGDTGAKTATGNGATITNVGNKGVQILVNMGAVTGTTPTAVIKVQGSTDAGTSWYDIPGATTATLTATGLYGITIYPGIAVTAGVATTGTTATASMVIPRTWRIVWTIGGTTPSFTITNVQYIYIPN